MESQRQKTRGVTPRWAFAGCKPQAIGVLTALAGHGFLPEFAVVMPEAPEADIRALRAWCEDNGVELVLSGDLLREIDRLGALDLLLLCRYNIVKPAVFGAPWLGTVNIHSSLLPAYRGVHPVSWALINGERETGVTLHSVDSGVDTGGILGSRSLMIEDQHDLWSLTRDLDLLSAALAVELFSGVRANGTLPTSHPQKGSGSYAPRRAPEDGRIDWTASARSVFNLVRALPQPLPPAFARHPDGGDIHIEQARIAETRTKNGVRPGEVLSSNGHGWFEIACGDGSVLECRAERPVVAGSFLT